MPSELQSLAIGLFGCSSWNEQLPSVVSLQAVLEHGPVDFTEDVVTDLDDVVRPNTEDVGIERSVVDLAQRKPVGDDGLTLLM